MRCGAEQWLAAKTAIRTSASRLWQQRQRLHGKPSNEQPRLRLVKDDGQ